jgi:hypothetical protein
MNCEDRLLGRLLVEMFQSEQSACEHPTKEARRLAGSPPAEALRAVSSHASRVLPELRALAKREGFGGRRGGRLIGTLFSFVREIATDPILSQEKSYRATLLGIQHGVDCGLLAAAAARAGQREALVAFFERWLEERTQLLAACRQQVPWFAQHGELALRKAF